MKRFSKRVLPVILAAIILVTAVPFGVSPALTGSVLPVASAANYTVGDIVQFGEYPQTKVTDAATISALGKITGDWHSYGYYAPSAETGEVISRDFMEYKDVDYNGNKYRGVRFSEYRPERTSLTTTAANSFQDDNGYYVNTVYWFKYEPLIWHILDPETGLVLCDTIIDSQAICNKYWSKDGVEYQNEACTIYANNYPNSDMDRWLNSSFFDAAFSEEQKQEIAASEIDNNAYSSSYSQYNGANSNAKVYLISWDQFNNGSYRIVKAAPVSDYAKCQGLGAVSGSNNWWLRTPGRSPYASVTIYENGKAYDNLATHRPCIGVRPAFRFKNGIVDAVTPSQEIPSDAISFNGHYYKVFHQQSYWSYAARTCKLLGGHLVTITSAEEQAFLNGLNAGDVWIGLRGISDTRTKTAGWAWVTGEPFAFNNWSSTEPSGTGVGGNEEFVAMWPNTWNDLINTSYEQSGFICEWEGGLTVGDQCDGITYSISILPATRKLIIRDHRLYDTFGNHVDSVNVMLTLTNHSNALIASNMCINASGRGVTAIYSDRWQSVAIGETKTGCIASISEETILSLCCCFDYTIEFDVYAKVNNNTEAVFVQPLYIPIEYDLSNARYINGYSFWQDSFSFINLDENIDKKYYYEMFGSLRGDLLYKKYEFKDGELKTHGHCYGMAMASALIWNGSATVNDFPSDTIRSLKPESFSNVMQMTLQDYIKYCYIYQFSFDVDMEERSRQSQKYNKLYQAVLDQIDQNGKPLLVSLHNKGECEDHAVLAIGIDGEDILVYDSNKPNKICRINYDAASENWIFESANSSWTNADHGIGFLSYVNILGESIIRASLNTATSITHLMIKASNNIGFIDADKLIEIIPKQDGASAKDSDTKLYWLNEGNEISAVNTSGQAASFSVVGNTIELDAELPANAEICAQVTDDAAEAELSCRSGDLVELSIVTLNENDERVPVKLTGVVDNNAVRVEGDGDQIRVEGMNSITATLETPEGTQAQTTADVTDGRAVNITVNEAESTVSTDYVVDEPENPTEPAEPTEPTDPAEPEVTETLCKYCGKDHGTSFLGRLAAFIHAILYFFAHLFGKM